MEEAEERVVLHPGYCVSVDEDGYVRSVGWVLDAIEGGIMLDSLDGYDFTGERLHAYRWDGEKLAFDEDRWSELAKEQVAAEMLEKISELTARLRETDGVVLEALEGLLSATTITGFLAALVSAARSIRETLAERTDLRTRIEALKNS